MNAKTKILISLCVVAFFAIPATNASFLSTSDLDLYDVECHLTGAENIANGAWLYVTSIPTLYFECGDAIDEVRVQVDGVIYDGDIVDPEEEYSVYYKSFTLQPGQSNGIALSDIKDGFYKITYYGRIDVSSTNPTETPENSAIIFDGTDDLGGNNGERFRVDTKGPSIVLSVQPTNGAKIAWTVTADIDDLVSGVHEVRLLIKGEEYDLIEFDPVDVPAARCDWRPNIFVWDITGLDGLTSSGDFKVTAEDWAGHEESQEKARTRAIESLLVQLLGRIASRFPMLSALLF